jgi:hypothetical protein
MVLLLKGSSVRVFHGVRGGYKGTDVAYEGVGCRAMGWVSRAAGGV